jgi:DNA repair protein RadD
MQGGAVVIELRPYQSEAVQAIYDYFAKETGNPLVVLPTGAGKSLTMADFIKGACTQFTGTRIILLTHVKELIQQDAQAIIRYWPDAPIGIWSASLGKKVKHQITVAGIQSIHRLPASFAGTDLVLIDEAHLLSKKADTPVQPKPQGYRPDSDPLPHGFRFADPG